MSTERGACVCTGAREPRVPGWRLGKGRRSHLVADISEERQCGRDTRKKGRGRQGERRRGETGGGEVFYYDVHFDLVM